MIIQPTKIYKLRFDVTVLRAKLYKPNFSLHKWCKHFYVTSINIYYTCVYVKGAIAKDHVDRSRKGKWLPCLYTCIYILYSYTLDTTGGVRLQTRLFMVITSIIKKHNSDLELYKKTLLFYF